MLGYLPLVTPAHQLTDGLTNVPKASASAHRLAAGKLAAFGIDGEAPFVRCVHRVKEGTDFSLSAEARVFEAHGLEDRVSIIEFGELNILGAISRHFVGPPSGEGHRSGSNSVGLPDKVVVAGARRRPQDVYRWIG